MANLHKFIVSDKLGKTVVSGVMDDDSSTHIEIAGDLYIAGDIIYLPENQANHYLKSSYLINGLLEYAGEVEVGDTSMTPEFMTLYDAKLGPKKNILPIVALKLATNLVKAVDPFAVVGGDSAGGFISARRLYVSKIGIKYMVGTSVAGAAIRAPWFLVTSGVPTLAAPSLLTSYTYLTGAYAAATNGNIGVATPITWAASDMLIVGYTEKFASAMWDMTTQSSAATTVTVFYWTASGWKEFLGDNGLATTVDYTKEIDGKTLSRAAPGGDKTRMVWWVKPEDWLAGGPSGSGASPSDYCVAIKFSGALTALVAGSVYPVLDSPMTHINLGSYDYGTEHYYMRKAGVYTNNILPLAGWGDFAGAPTDALFIATDNKWTSLFIDMSAAVNDVDTTLTYAYWNGIEWISMVVTDGTETHPAPFAKDGWMTITSPIPTDWKKCLGSTVDANLTATGEHYWFRIGVSAGGPLKALTAAASVESNVLAANVWHYFDIKNDGLVESGAPIHITCAFEEATVDKVEIMAIASDI